MSLLAQCPAQEVCAATGLHADQFDLQVCSEVEQLFARKLLPHHDLAMQINPNQMKRCFAKIDTDRV